MTDLLPVQVPDAVIGGLVTRAINDLLTDAEPGGCCPQCCDACAALLWLRDNAPNWTGRAAAAAVGVGWDWQQLGGSINWKLINARWANADQLGCHEDSPEAAHD